MTNRPTIETLRELAVHEPGQPVLSVHVRTDPSDPANLSQNPAWQIELRNGLAAAERRLEEAGADRDERAALRDLAADVLQRIAALEPAERGRSVSLFRGVGGDPDLLLTSQLALRATVVAWDRRPLIGPLVEVVDRGAPLGLVLVDGDEARLVHVEGGRASSPEDPVYELELHDWGRDRRGPGHSRGGVRRGTSHIERAKSHEEEQQRRLMNEIAAALSTRLPELGWERLLLVAAPGTVDLVTDSLSQEVRERVVAIHEAHLTGLSPQEAAEHLSGQIEAAWRSEAEAAVREAAERSASGGSGATGVAEVLDVLAQGRVDRLVYSPDLRIAPEQVGPQVRAAVGEVADDMWLERAIEYAVETGARPSALQGDAELDRLGGIVATLRW